MEISEPCTLNGGQCLDKEQQCFLYLLHTTVDACDASNHNQIYRPVIRKYLLQTL
jgi:hypothetical protein